MLPISDFSERMSQFYFFYCFYPTVGVSFTQPTNATNDRLEDTKLYGNASERQAAHYDRDHPRYPYKSHGQWLKGFYGMAACIILVTFNGVSAFLERPFDVRRFIASYVSVCSDFPDSPIDFVGLTQNRSQCLFF